MPGTDFLFIALKLKKNIVIPPEDFM